MSSTEAPLAEVLRPRPSGDLRKPLVNVLSALLDLACRLGVPVRALVASERQGRITFDVTESDQVHILRTALRTDSDVRGVSVGNVRVAYFTINVGGWDLDVAYTNDDDLEGATAT